MVLLCLVWCLASPAIGRTPWAQEELSPDQAHHLFEQACSLTREHFYDPHLSGIDWDQRQQVYEARLSSIHTRGELRDLINELLDELHTSHTHLYGLDDPMYPILASTFGPRAPNFPARLFPRGRIVEDDPGLFTVTVQDQVFIKALLEGGPAERAGLKIGDRLVEVGSEAPTWEAWQGHRDLEVTYQRTADAPPEQVTVHLLHRNPQDGFVQAMWDSRKVVNIDGHKVGYIHVWAFTSPQLIPTFQRALRESFADCDGLILDLRDGIGGGLFEFFMPWATAIPRVTFTGRDGHTWSEPVRVPSHLAVLINEGSRSAKEIYAFGLQFYHHGTLVGTTTAGAVRGGSAFYLDDGEFLYLATTDVSVDGYDLEHHGVTPDVPVPRPIPYCDGQDPPYDAALGVMSHLLH